MVGWIELKEARDVLGLLKLMGREDKLGFYSKEKKLTVIRHDKEQDVMFSRKELYGEYKILKKNASGLKIKLKVNATYVFDRSDFNKIIPFSEEIIEDTINFARYAPDEKK